jgi:hypothetical protein
MYAEPLTSQNGNGNGKRRILSGLDPSIKGCFLTASSETYSEELRKKKGRQC